MNGSGHKKPNQRKKAVNLKKRIYFFITVLIAVFLPINASAAMLKIMVNYKKGYEKIDHKMVDIKDGYWKFPVVEVPKTLEREKYAIVIEGYSAIKKVDETVELTGAGVSRNSILLPVEGVVKINNKEDFPRKVNVLREGEDSEVVELEVPAKGSVSYSFSSAADYTLVDTLFQWNTVYVRVLRTSYLFPIDEGPNRIEIPDIAPGSYTMRIYYGIRWVYQEDFVMISNAAQSIGYKIEEGVISSINSTSYSTTISMPGN